MDETSGSTSGEPPSYDETIAKDLLTRAPTTKDDGRLNVDIDSRAVKTLSRILNFEAPSAQDSGKKPHTLPIYDDQGPPKGDSELFPVKLNIVIQVVGSRGDVQPFVALGAELQKHGHRVRLATHDVFDSFVRDAGLGFFPIGGDPAELMAYMVRNPGLIPSMKSLRAGDIQKKRNMMSEILNRCWLSCIQPDPLTSDPFVADAIIANPPSFAHIHCAQALGIPVHMMFTMPWTSTKAFPHPLVNLKFSHGSGTEPMTANYISYAVVEFLTWQGLGDVINEWRETIDLEPIAFSEGPCLAETLKVPFTYCWSPVLVPKPVDWDSHIDVCGFFFREPLDYAPPPELEEFLRAGPPPVYIGFGSIVLDDPKKMSEMLLEAFAITGTRGLISRGWSNLDGPESSDIMFLGDCPHEWLFPRVSSVIHHGGAGTTACGLLNGRPTTIVPFFGDQPFWGEMVAAAGVGPKPIPQKSLTVDNLVEAIRFCLTPAAAEAAQRIAVQMQSESGVEAAVSSFHANLPRRELECDIIKGQPAAWKYTSRRTRVKLSKMAAEILSNHLKVDFRSLKMHQSRRTVIETRRWDPITGTIAAAMGVGADLAKTATNTVTRPVKARQRPGGSEQGTEVGFTELDTVAMSRQSRPAKNSRGCTDATKSLTVGIGNFGKKLTGGLVIIPLAFTEGFRSVPLLYGEEIRDYGEIHDWKSGAMVGAKSVVYGVVDGVGGLFLLPYKGAKQQGAIGAVKGVGKGLAGLGSKIFTATIGIGTYPLQGVYKSVLLAANSKTRHSIDLARVAEGRFVADRVHEEGFDDKVVMDAFDALINGELLI